MLVICSRCGETVPEVKFNSGEHSCIRESAALPAAERLARLRASGGCSQAYYDAEMLKLERNAS